MQGTVLRTLIQEVSFFSRYILKASLELITPFEWADNSRIVHQYAIDSLNNATKDFNSKFLQSLKGSSPTYYLLIAKGEEKD